MRGRGNHQEAGKRVRSRVIPKRDDIDYDPEWDYQQRQWDPKDDRKPSPDTPGARARTCLSLKDLAQNIDDNDYVIISDVHAQFDRLRDLLLSLDLITPDGNRKRTQVHLVQIGDLIDGRDMWDEKTLEEGSHWFDTIIAGNHEAAYLGGQTFPGYWPRPTLTHMLKRLMWDEKLKGALDCHGYLVSHAGAHPDLWHTELGSQVLAQKIDERWRMWLGQPDGIYPELFTLDKVRSPGMNRNEGGIMWLDWRNFVSDMAPAPTDDEGEFYQDEDGNPIDKNPTSHDPALKQIVGHTPLARVEESLDSSLINIDIAGACLGIAIVKPDGTVLTGDDRH